MGDQEKAPKGLPYPEKDPLIAAEAKAEKVYEFLGRADLIGLLRSRDQQNFSLRGAVTNLRKEVRKLNQACYNNRSAELRMAEQRRISERLRDQNNEQLHRLEEAGIAINTQALTIKQLLARVDQLEAEAKQKPKTPTPTPVKV